MKKIFQFIGLFTLICFSFFYTEKVVTVLNEQDPIMVEIENKKDNYYVEPIDAIIKDNTIIPGIMGHKVNINKTYNNMKKIGFFSEKNFIYNDIKPSISINNNYDKYIIKGNNKKNSISLLFIIKEDKYLEDLIDIAKNKNITINLFMTTDYLNNNISKLYKLTHSEIYNYGSNGTYQKDLIILGNNIINRNTKNTSSYCLTKEMFSNTLNICSKSKMHTIYPNKIINNNFYSNIKNDINSGDIILFELNKNMLEELNTITDFIKKKGINIVGLKELLSEWGFIFIRVY